MSRVLIVEDDAAMAAALRDGFEFEGYTVSLAGDGAEALRLASDADLIVLDVMLPKLSGLDVCKRIRKEGNPVPIIMLTARGQEIDKVLGLKSGADDYVTKPFGFMELLARVEAVLRRARGAVKQAGACRFGDVEVDFARCEASKAGRPVDLFRWQLRYLKKQGYRSLKISELDQYLEGRLELDGPARERRSHRWIVSRFELPGPRPGHPERPPGDACRRTGHLGCVGLHVRNYDCRWSLVLGCRRPRIRND